MAVSVISLWVSYCVSSIVCPPLSGVADGAPDDGIALDSLPPALSF